MGNNTNPAEIYSGTTWELLPDNKFLKTGNTPLQLAGSNNISISKANLPAEKLQVEAHSMTRGTMNITGEWYAKALTDSWGSGYTSGALYKTNRSYTTASQWQSTTTGGIGLDASRNWTGSTSSASPYTSAMGNGIPIYINPEHITVKAWKRLS